MGFNPFKSVGKAVKGITKPFKKVLRSPIGKAAMAYAMYQYGPAMFGESAGGMRGLQGWQKGLAAKAPWLYTPGTEATSLGSIVHGAGKYKAATPAGGILGKAAGFAKAHPFITAGGAAMAAGAVGDDVLEEKETVIDTSGHEGYLRGRKGFVDEWTEWLVDQGHDEVTARAMAEKELFAKAEGGVVGLAQGGRIGMRGGNPHEMTGGNTSTHAGHTNQTYSDGQGIQDAKEKYIHAMNQPQKYFVRGALGADPREKKNYFNRPTVNPTIHQGGGGQGAQPTWQRLGYPSYAAWLAAQQSQGGGGGTGTGGVGDYYGFKEWEDWAGAPTTPMFGDATQYQRLLSQGGRIGLYAGGMGGMNNSMNPMMNQGLGATGAQGMNPYNQQNLMAQGQMRGQPQGRPPMPGGPTTDQGPGITSARLPKKTEDNELLQLIKMLASMGIPMEQLRGRTKEELVEMVMSLSAKAEAQGGREEVVEESEEIMTAAGGGRVRAAGGFGESYPPQGSYPNSDLEFQTEEQSSMGNPGNAEMYMEEIKDQQAIAPSHPKLLDIAEMEWDEYDGPLSHREWFRKWMQDNVEGWEGRNVKEESEEVMTAAGGGLMRTAYAMGTEQPVIPSRDGSQLDFRGIGGYQPHGAKEKKDDVRALLAQGEFVVTSDAVKGIGEGDRDLGAKRMYDMMHKYEPIGRALS